MWVFRPERAWQSLHEGADVRIPRVFKLIMTYVTPAYLFVILGWWAATDALPILRLERGAGGGVPSESALPYIIISRGILLALLVIGLVLIRLAWKRNGYDDRRGLPEVPEPARGGIA